MKTITKRISEAATVIAKFKAAVPADVAEEACLELLTDFSDWDASVIGEAVGFYEGEALAWWQDGLEDIEMWKGFEDEGLETYGFADALRAVLAIEAAIIRAGMEAA